MKHVLPFLPKGLRRALAAVVIREIQRVTPTGSLDLYRLATIAAVNRALRL